MAKIVFGMNQSLDGYVDHDKFGPSPALFQHFIEQVRGLAGSVYGRRIYEVMRYWDEDHPEWEPVHRKLFTNGILGIENVGGDLDKVTGRRCSSAFFPWNWDRGDGCIIRLVAILYPTGSYPDER